MTDYLELSHGGLILKGQQERRELGGGFEDEKPWCEDLAEQWNYL